MQELDIVEYKNLDIEKVIEFFIEISSIPRESGNEKEIFNYLKQFAKDRNLQYETDNFYNIIIKKDNKSDKYIALQAHIDMICEKEQNCKHNFYKDPIKLYKDGDFIKANGTTLGADNGIGMAYILAILDSKENLNKNIEAIFTSQEETTMLGAINLNLTNLKSNQIISLDNGKEGKLLVSSANCKEWKIGIDIEYEEINKNMEVYELSYQNFKGGHSGGNIGDEKRGNPIKLAMEALKNCKIQIIEIRGGSRVNVIPRDMYIKFVLENQEMIGNIQKELQKQNEFYGEEVLIKLTKTKENEKKAFSKKISTNIINWILEYQNGVLKKDNSGNIILSSNLGAIRKNENKIEIDFSIRSNEKKIEEVYIEKIEKESKENNMQILWYQELKGIYRKENSELVNICKNLYRKMNKEDLEEVISQGVLEGGFFADKIKNCEYVAIGPNIYDAHSPKERVEISSLEKIWKYLKEICKN